MFARTILVVIPAEIPPVPILPSMFESQGGLGGALISTYSSEG